MDQGQGPPQPPPATERDIGFTERAVAAAGVAVVSAILVNPLDVCKVPVFALSVKPLFLNNNRFGERIPDTFDSTGAQYLVVARAPSTTRRRRCWRCCSSTTACPGASPTSGPWRRPPSSSTPWTSPSENDGRRRRRGAVVAHVLAACLCRHSHLVPIWIPLRVHGLPPTISALLIVLLPHLKLVLVWCLNVDDVGW